MMTCIDGSETVTFNIMPVADRGWRRRRTARATRSSTGTAGCGRTIGGVWSSGRGAATRRYI